MQGHFGERTSDPWITSRLSSFSLSNEAEYLRNFTRKVRRKSCSHLHLVLVLKYWSSCQHFHDLLILGNLQLVKSSSSHHGSRQQSSLLDYDQLWCRSGLCPPTHCWLWTLTLIILLVIWTWSIELVSLVIESQFSLADYNLDSFH